ncbi:hypothetical protein K439DRAFT_1630715 [Ramaria rubella]|nr:hypothetical protein K439DRAFT_1630715 [Ramaria rubella]
MDKNTIQNLLFVTHYRAELILKPDALTILARALHTPYTPCAIRLYFSVHYNATYSRHAS